MAIRRLSAILALDVAGYTEMMREDAASVLATLNAVYKDLITPVVTRHDGRVVKLMGDGALIEFDSAAQALVCASEIQSELRRPNSPHHSKMKISLRAGLHAGDVVVEGEDVFGDAVIIATRLQSAAPPGEVHASRLFCDLAGTQPDIQLRREGAKKLKGLDRPIEILSIDFGNREKLAVSRDFARIQEIRFCGAKDGASLAWTENGEGPPIVKAPNWIGHLELDWQNPGMRPFITTFAMRHRLIRFDGRCNGLSDWDTETINFDSFVDDLETVFEAAGVDRAPIVALSQGSAYAAAFAARHPERVTGIIMLGSFAIGRALRKGPKDIERAQAMREMMAAGWDDDYPSFRDLLAQIIMPSASEDERRVYAEDMRAIISPENIQRYRDVVDYLDVTELLPRVQAPCLVMHCRGDRMQPIEQGRKMAAGLPNARFIAFDSDNHLVPDRDPAWPLIDREIHRFLDEIGPA